MKGPWPVVANKFKTYLTIHNNNSDTTTITQVRLGIIIWNYLCLVNPLNLTDLIRVRFSVERRKRISSTKAHTSEMYILASNVSPVSEILKNLEFEIKHVQPTLVDCSSDCSCSARVGENDS